MSKFSRLLVSGAALVVTALSLSSCGAPTGSASTENGPIKIGLVTSLTGPFSVLGEGNLTGAQIAVKQLNDDGGINGRTVELAYKDDKTQPDQSVAAFNELASDKGVAAILGSTDSTSASASGPAAQRSKTAMLTMSPVTDLASGTNPYAFIVPSATRNYADVLVQYWKDNGFKNVAIAYDGKDVFGKSGLESTQGFANQAGVNIALAESYDPSATDFTALIKHIADAKADAVMVWGAGPAPVIITKQFEAANISAKLFMSGAQGSDLYVEPAGPSAEGVIVVGGISLSASAGDLPESDLANKIEEVATAYRADHTGYPSDFVFVGATGVFLVAEAIKNAGSTDRTKVRDALESLKYLAPSGPYSFSKDNHGGLGTEGLAVMEIRDGKFATTEYQKALFAKNGAPS